VGISLGFPRERWTLLWDLTISGWSNEWINITWQCFIKSDSRYLYEYIILRNLSEVRNENLKLKVLALFTEWLKLSRLALFRVVNANKRSPEFGTWRSRCHMQDKSYRDEVLSAQIQHSDVCINTRMTLQPWIEHAHPCGNIAIFKPGLICQGTSLLGHIIWS
jgi:hypothetical protein